MVCTYFQAHIINLSIGLDSRDVEKDVITVNEKKWTTRQKSRWKKMVRNHEIQFQLYRDQSLLQLKAIVLLVLAAITLGLLAAFIAVTLKESSENSESAKLVPFPDHIGDCRK